MTLLSIEKEHANQWQIGLNSYCGMKMGVLLEHQYFKFVVHNMIMRKSAIEKSCFIIRQQLGDSRISIQQLKEAMQSGDNALSKKNTSFKCNPERNFSILGAEGHQTKSFIPV